MAITRSAAAPRIVCDPRILGGAPVVRGTRVPVWTLAFLRKTTGDVDLLLREYPQLERGDVDAALVYYRTHMDEVDTEIAENQADTT